MNEIKLLAGVSALLLVSANANAQTVAPQPADKPTPTSSGNDSAANDRGQLSDIVVTATRRSESVQNVSVSVTALDAGMLRERNIQSGYDLANVVPNLSVQTIFGPGTPPYIAIRGINYIDTNFVNETPVGVYIDDVYQGDVGAAVGQSFDQERIEVLRGPQGTLFGRNSPAGAIQFISQKPKRDFGGYGQLQVGSFNQIIAEGALNLPLSNDVRIRVAGKYDTDDGIRRNGAIKGSRFGESDILGLRATGAADLTSWLTAEAGVHYTRNRSTIGGQIGYGKLDPATGRVCEPQAIHAGQCVTADGLSYPNPRPGLINSDQDSIPNNSTSIGGYGRLTAKVGDVNIVSITGLEKVKRFLAFDSDSFARVDPRRNIFISYAGRFNEFSEELRVSSDTGPFKWMLGAFYYEDEKQNIQTVFNGSGTSPAPFVLIQTSEAKVKTDAWAMFGQASIPLGSQFTLVGGGRYSNDKRDLVTYTTSGGITSPLGIPNARDKVFTGRGSLEWRPAQRIMLYAQYSTGSKSGGYNVGLGLTPANLSAAGPVRPERVSNYEVGLRSDLFDNRLRFNLTGFYMPYKDLQVQANFLNPATNRFQQQFFNLEKSTVYGSELEVQFVPSRTFDAQLGVGLLRTKISDSRGLLFRSDLPGSLPGSLQSLDYVDGNRLPSAPTASLNGSLRYHVYVPSNGRVTGQIDGRYQSRVFFGPDNNRNEYQNGYAIVNLRLRWETEQKNYSAEAFVSNLFDTLYTTHAFDSNSDYFYRTPSNPRQFGFKIGANF